MLHMDRILDRIRTSTRTHPARHRSDAARGRAGAVARTDTGCGPYSRPTGKTVPRRGAGLGGPPDRHADRNTDRADRPSSSFPPPVRFESWQLVERFVSRPHVLTTSQFLHGSNVRCVGWVIVTCVHDSRARPRPRVRRFLRKRYHQLGWRLRIGMYRNISHTVPSENTCEDSG